MLFDEFVSYIFELHKYDVHCYEISDTADLELDVDAFVL